MSTLASGGHRSLRMPPVEAPIDGDRPILHTEPSSEILLLGLLVRDAELQVEKLRKLMHAPANGYRGELRVIANAAQRVMERAMVLIGD